MEQSGARLVDVGTTNRTRLADYERAPRPPGRRRGARPEGAPVELPGRGLHRERSRCGRWPRWPLPVVVDIGSGLLDAACPWLADGPPAVAGRRAGGPPDAGRRRRAGHVQRRQAPRRAPGRGHRRPRRARRRAAPPIPSPGRCGPAASCSARCRTSPSPTCAATATRCPSGARPPCRSTSSAGGPRSLAAGVRRRAVVATEALPGAGALPGPRHPVGRRRGRRRPPRAAPCPRPADRRPRPGRPHRARPPHRRARRRPPAPTRSAPSRPPPGTGRAEVHVVATAGHVDHGKSSLVLALTGTDPDRFEEEKRRGLTIDLGFAHTTLPVGRGHLVRRRARPRPLPQEHAGRGGRRRRLPVRGGGHRGLEAAVRGAPADPRAARHRPRRRRAHEGRHGRRRGAGHRPPRPRRPRRRARSWTAPRSWRWRRRPGAASTSCATRSTACSCRDTAGHRPRPARACGSTGSSPPGARAPS